MDGIRRRFETLNTVRIASICALLQITHTGDYFVSRAEESFAKIPVKAERKNDQSVVIDIASFRVLV